MAVRSVAVSVSNSVTAVTSSVQDTKNGNDDVARTVVIQNPGATACYLGGPDVSSTNGYLLPAAGEVAMDLTGTDVLFGVTASGTAALRVLHLGV